MKFLDDEKLRYIILSIIIILELMIIGLEVMCTDCKEVTNATQEVLVVEENKEEVTKVEEEIVKVKVDIKGAVKKPGVYELDQNARVSDAIKMAGGLKSNASTKYLNLSKKITDEMVIKVYTENQIKNMNIIYNVVDECNCSSVDISSCAGASVIVSSDSSSNTNDSSNSNSSSKISLNKATKEELMTLSGIGESKALAIIEYRKENEFKSIEDIMNVSGIGEALYNKIKDDITL